MEAGTISPAGDQRSTVHRLVDLDVRGRLCALALAVALLVAPVSSAVRMFGTWTPAGDTALIEMRARDAGTVRTPLVGQPSTSSLYGEKRQNAAHPGPIEFYLLAPAVRVFGGDVGMLLTTAAISGVSVLVAAWAVFRQLGSRAGLAAAIALAAMMWTVGAAAMVNPISSVVGGFPLLCSVVLLWCLLAGDVRLLPLTCVMVSFTAQQHLSLAPVTAVVTAVGAIGLVVALVRDGVVRDPVRRREALRSLALAVGVTLVLWSTVIYEQLTRSPGNVERIIQYAGDSTRADVGYGSALRQVAHVVGLPPLLGRTNLSGSDLLAPVPVLTAVTALALITYLAVGAVRWRRRSPRLSALVVMAGALAVGGLLNGASVPDSFESDRIAFYHWGFTLAFLELLILLVVAATLLRRPARSTTTARAVTLPALAVPAVLVLVLVPAVGNLLVSREDNTIGFQMPKSAIDDIESGVRAHRGELAKPTLLVSQGDHVYVGLDAAVAARLDAAGIDVVHPADLAGYVHERRLVDYRTVRSAIVIVRGIGPPRGIPGKLIATADPIPGFDRQAFNLLLRQARSASRVVLGRALDLRLRRLTTTPGLSRNERKYYAAYRDVTIAALRRLKEHPEATLAERSTLRLLAETPLASPVLDHRAIERVLRTFPDQSESIEATDVSVFLQNRRELLKFEPQTDQGRGQRR